MPIATVNNKSAMYELLRAGKFGNTARSWATYQELVDSDYRGLVGVRSKQPGGKFLAHVPFYFVVDAPDCVYSEMQRDELILLQGEVYRSFNGLYVFASTVKRPMREALKLGGRHFYRSAARVALEVTMWPTDYEELLELMAEYPESVVEFSAYSTEVGILPGRNTIIWEVRNY